MRKGLPLTPAQLRRHLLWLLAGAGLSMAAASGAGTYVFAERHIERAAVERVRSSFVHLDGLEHNGLLGQGIHAGVARFLTPEHFIGLQLRSAGGVLVAERWATGLDPAVRHAALSSSPRYGGELRRSGDEAFVRVLHQLDDPSAAGTYAEAYYRLDPETVHSIDPLARGSALIGAATVTATMMLLYPLLLGLTRRSVGLSRDLLESNLDLMRALGSAIALRDSDTDTHNYRVALYAVRLAERLDLPVNQIADLLAGSFLHDVGKIGVPDAILLKPGPLSAGEVQIMRQHPLLGETIVARSRWLAGARTIVRHHHERFDGSGYPAGLAGKDIPLAARLFAVVDVFDALTTKRPYKAALPLAEALRIMREDIAGQLDPGLLDVFTRNAALFHSSIGQASEEALHGMLAQDIRRYYPSLGLSADTQNGSTVGEPARIKDAA